MENPIKMDDLGGTIIFGSTQIVVLPAINEAFSASELFWTLWSSDCESLVAFAKHSNGHGHALKFKACFLKSRLKTKNIEMLA